MVHISALVHFSGVKALHGGGGGGGGAHYQNKAVCKIMRDSSLTKLMIPELDPMIEKDWPKIAEYALVARRPAQNAAPSGLVILCSVAGL